jgi:hypothetical protein
MRGLGVYCVGVLLDAHTTNSILTCCALAPLLLCTVELPRPTVTVAPTVAPFALHSLVSSLRYRPTIELPYCFSGFVCTALSRLVVPFLSLVVVVLSTVEYCYSRFVSFALPRRRFALSTVELSNCPTVDRRGCLRCLLASSTDPYHTHHTPHKLPGSTIESW